MKNLIPTLAVVALCYACSPTTLKNTDQTVAVTTSALVTTLKVSPKANGTNHPVLKFTVKNQADTAASFCKWHTPFEPLLSKYLDITDPEGKDVDYKGAMAKRIMPPPADSYMRINPGDSLTVDIDLLKGYAIDKPGAYTVKYSGTNMSGLSVQDSIKVDFKP